MMGAYEKKRRGPREKAEKKEAEAAAESARLSVDVALEKEKGCINIHRQRARCRCGRRPYKERDAGCLLRRDYDCTSDFSVICDTY
jgi:hypothetical protein